MERLRKDMANLVSDIEAFLYPIQLAIKDDDLVMNYIAIIEHA